MVEVDDKLILRVPIIAFTQRRDNDFSLKWSFIGASHPSLLKLLKKKGFSIKPS